MPSIWPRWNDNPLFTICLAVTLGFLTLFLGVKIWNDLATHQLIGKAPTARDVITIDGQGKVSGKPTLGQVDVGLYTEGTDVPVTQAENTRKVNEITRAMKELGVADADIATNNYTIYPRYEYHEGKQKVMGYSVSQNLHLTIRDLAKVGQALALATHSGANQINGVTFTIDDPTSLKQEARKKALADARAKAVELADALDVDLSHVVTFTESSDVPATMPYAYRSEASSPTATPVPDIQPGSLDIFARVSVTFEIR